MRKRECERDQFSKMRGFRVQAQRRLPLAKPRVVKKSFLCLCIVRCGGVCMIHTVGAVGGRATYASGKGRDTTSRRLRSRRVVARTNCSVILFAVRYTYCKPLGRGVVVGHEKRARVVDASVEEQVALSPCPGPRPLRASEMDCSAETAQPTGRAAVSATALSTGPATPVSPAVSAAPPPSTFDSNKVTTAAQYDPMQLDNAANDASSTRQQGDRVDEAFSLSSSRSANRVVGPFTLSPGKADAASHSDTDEAAPSISRDKRPLGADSSPVKDAADDAAHGSGDAANDSAVEPPKKKARKSAGPKAVTQYCHQGALQLLPPRRSASSLSRCPRAVESSSS